MKRKFISIMMAAVVASSVVCFSGCSDDDMTAAEEEEHNERVETNRLSKDKSTADTIYTAFTNTAGDPDCSSELIGKSYIFTISDGKMELPESGSSIGGKKCSEAVVEMIKEYVGTDTLKFKSEHFQEAKMHIIVTFTGKVLVWMDSDDGEDYDFFVNCEDQDTYDEALEKLESETTVHKGNTTKETEKATQRVEEMIESQEKVSEGLYEVKMNATWNFKDGSLTSDNAYVANVTSNTNDVYFDVTLNDTGENIYRSPIIPVGSELSNITLEKQLAAGTYDCTLTYTLIDENKSPVSTLAVAITIVIGS